MTSTTNYMLFVAINFLINPNCIQFCISPVLKLGTYVVMAKKTKKFDLHKVASQLFQVNPVVQISNQVLKDWKLLYQFWGRKCFFVVSTEV